MKPPKRLFKDRPEPDPGESKQKIVPPAKRWDFAAAALFLAVCHRKIHDPGEQREAMMRVVRGAIDRGDGRVFELPNGLGPGLDDGAMLQLIWASPGIDLDRRDLRDQETILSRMSDAIDRGISGNWPDVVFLG